MTTIVNVSESQKPSCVSPTPSSPVAIKPERESTLQKVSHAVKIIAAIALFMVGLSALAFWSFGAAVAVIPAIIMLVVMVVAFALVLIGVRDSAPAKVARELKKQVEDLREENQRFDVENSRLSEQVECLSEMNNDLSEQLQGLSALSNQLRLFGSRLEVHTGDFSALVLEFKENLKSLHTFGAGIGKTFSSFEAMLSSLQSVLSQDGIKELTESVASLRTQTTDLQQVVDQAKQALDGIRQETVLKEQQVKFLQEKQSELEASCEKLTATIQHLETVAQKISIEPLQSSSSEEKQVSEAATSTSTPEGETSETKEGEEDSSVIEFD